MRPRERELYFPLRPHAEAGPDSKVELEALVSCPAWITWLVTEMRKKSHNREVHISCCLIIGQLA